jgi:hypothetical protein
MAGKQQQGLQVDHNLKHGNYFGHCPSSSVFPNSIPETGSISIVRCRAGKIAIQFGLLVQ